MPMDAEITTLSKSLLYELVGSVGLPRDHFHSLFYLIFHSVTDRLARIGVTFNRNITEVGFSRAMGLALPDFVKTITERGIEETPPAGPLLVVSNHPGTYDSLIITSRLRRDDACIISGDIPFLKKMPEAHRHFFFTAPNPLARALAARKAIRHLQGGGAVLMYGYGSIDPDPAVYPNAEQHIEHWSPSIDLFLKTVPEAHLLICTVSHVVSPKWRHSPLYWLRRKPLDRRRLVEFGQVMFQLLFPRKLLLSPYISFGPLASVPELRRESGEERLLPAIIRRGKALLAEHIAWTDSFAEE
jgi:hypothetical protein